MEKFLLSNGMRVWMEHVPHLMSATFGIWIESGARHEPPPLYGISHFIEHMLFKGTPTHSTADIAYAFDSIGGQTNAYTTKEYTCLYSKTLDEHLHIAIDVLTDMFFNSKFEARDIEMERGVILEEMDMYEDSPDEVVVDKLFENIWRDSSLGHSILGQLSSINTFDTDILQAYTSSHYGADNTILTISGKYDREAVLALLESNFCSLQNANFSPDQKEVSYTPSVVATQKSIEQNHYCIGMPGLPLGDDMLYPLASINNIFGNGMSSRLFQRLRENMGIVYSVYSFVTSHRDTGMIGIYAGCSSESEKQAITICIEELNNLILNGVTKEELLRSKAQLKANTIMGMESNSARMNMVAKSELMRKKIIPPEEMIERIDNIDITSIEETIHTLCSNKNLSLSAVGRTMKTNEYEELIGR